MVMKPVKDSMLSKLLRFLTRDSDLFINKSGRCGDAEHTSEVNYKRTVLGKRSIIEMLSN